MPGHTEPEIGDKKKLYFVATRQGFKCAIEVKWAWEKAIRIEKDVVKLSACLSEHKNWTAFLCVFGKKSVITEVVLPAGLFKEQDAAVIANFGKTRLGCRVYEMTRNDRSDH